MKLNIDALDSVTDWVVNAPSTISEITEKTFIAGLNAKSLLIKFDSSDTVKTATKTFGTPIDVSSYDTLVFSIWSQKYGVAKQYIKPSTFSYKIDIDGVREFYIPVWGSFSDIEIGIEDVSQITKIQITALHTKTDYIIISNMVAEKQEIELDILTAVKEHVDYWIEQVHGDGLLLGTVSATAGDTSITMTNPTFLDRYGVVKIDDSVNNETHQVEDNNAGAFQLNDNFDGDQMVNAFANANVYLQYPSFINPGQREIALPGISIWGIDVNPVLRGAKLDIIRDSFLVSGGSKERVEGQIYSYPVLLNVESRSQELIMNMSKAIRRFIALESLWVNGRRHDIFFNGPAVESESQSGIDYIPHVQYGLSVEIKEKLNDRVSVPETTTIDTTVTIQ